MSDPAFHQTQEMPTVWRTAIMLVILVPVIVLARQGVWDALAIFVIVIGLAAVASWIMFQFAVTVGPDGVSWSFRYGLMKRRLSLATITSANPDRVSPFWGYGVRWTPRGTLYRATGARVVRLGLTSGRSIFIGSTDPEALVTAIEAARMQARASG